MMIVFGNFVCRPSYAARRHIGAIKLNDESMWYCTNAEIIKSS